MRNRKFHHTFLQKSPGSLFLQFIINDALPPTRKQMASLPQERPGLLYLSILRTGAFFVHLANFFTNKNLFWILKKEDTRNPANQSEKD